MFAKTFCKPGAFLSVVPLGLRTTIQYNANGLIEKVFVGYDDTKTNVSDTLLPVLKSSKIVPLSVPIKGGTTWVKGVFYTTREFFDEGVLPMCIESSMLEDIKVNPQDYTFYAGNVDSLASSFKAVMTIRNWLSMSKFNLLPGWIIPADLTNEAFIKMVDTERFPFKFPLISGYMIYEGAHFFYLPLNLQQCVVTKVTRFNDESGYIKAKLQTADKDIVVQYSDAIRYNINTQTALVQNKDGKILYATCSDGKKRDKRTNKLTCSVCGKQFLAPQTGPVTCDDIHCRSKLYPDVCKFLKVLNLPEISHERFAKLIASGHIVCLTDIFLLDEYKELTTSITLGKLLEAVVPVDVCSDTSVFTMFANRCDNSTQTFRYYIENASRLITDLNLNSIFVKRLIDWLQDGYNVTTLDTLLEIENIKIITKDKKFDGAPIFRGKTILITGKFLHGDMTEIISILQSYEAKVVTQYVDHIDCVLVGDLKDGIDGKVIQLAKANGVPMFDEGAFFSEYGIDEDLASNLL